MKTYKINKITETKYELVEFNQDGDKSGSSIIGWFSNKQQAEFYKKIKEIEEKTK